MDGLLDSTEYLDTILGMNELAKRGPDQPPAAVSEDALDRRTLIPGCDHPGRSA